MINYWKGQLPLREICVANIKIWMKNNVCIWSFFEHNLKAICFSQKKTGGLIKAESEIALVRTMQIKTFSTGKQGVKIS